MRAEKPHRLPGGEPHRRQAESFDEAFDSAVGGWITRAVIPKVQAEAETRNAPELSARDQSPAASLSSIRASAVEASGTRNSASASTINAKPSLVESE
jgi:hypothetical protein